MYYQSPQAGADSLYSTPNGSIIILSTRDNTAFFQALVEQFGPPTDTVDAGIRWHEKKLFGYPGASLYVLGYSDLEVHLQGEGVSSDRPDSLFYAFFEQLYREKIRTAPPRPQTNTYAPITPEYDMQEVLSFNADSMAHCFDAFACDTLNMFSVSWQVDKKGQFQWPSDSMRECPPALRRFLVNMLCQTVFPLLIHRESGDTIAYTVSWEQFFAERTLKAYYLRQIQADLKAGAPRLREAPENHWPYRWGHWFDSARTHLYLCMPDPHSVIYLFEIQNYRFVELQRFEHGFYGPEVDISDLNADGLPELSIWSHPNMNGNSWNLVLAYNPAAGRFEEAGHFSTDCTIDSLHHRVFEEYAGSWYMPNTRTLYAWQGRRLLRVKQARIELAGGFMGSESLFFYLENPLFQQGIDSLQLREQGVYRETRRQKQLWESIFEGKPED
jgi:hypothetical protein